ncbi:MAG: S9 family peptidase, partial [Flavobacteriales bacterium]|nr:S9 family peptidase [Flavobacteriales bacterium]
GNISSWMTDHEGKIRLAVATDGVNHTLLTRANESSEFTKVITTDFKEDLTPIAFTPDNKNIYAVSNLGRDKSAAVVFDLKTGKETEVLYENPDYDISYLFYSDAQNQLISASYTSWKRERKFFDKKWEEDFNYLNDQIGEYELAMTSMNEKEDKVIVRTYSDRTLGEYYYFDRNSKELEKLCEVSPWLKEENMADMTPIEYESRDGLTINGYLTLPKGRDPKNLPVVINPHGGPWARDSWGFNPQVQFLANRGYAVLQMNFRGSTGYGREFWEKSFKQWGKTMQDDITDGVNWLVDQGIADKDRVAIYGGSYGGYATLAGVTFTPDLYACAIDYVGVSNMFTFMNTIPPYWEQYRAMFYEMVGDPKKDSLALREVSPVYHVDKIKAPLFVAQGRNDPRVNVAESDQIVEALNKRGIDVEYMVKDNEGHGFRNEENKYEFYGAMEKFLNKHIGSGMEAGPM